MEEITWNRDVHERTVHAIKCACVSVWSTNFASNNFHYSWICNNTRKCNSDFVQCHACNVVVFAVVALYLQ